MRSAIALSLSVTIAFLGLAAATPAWAAPETSITAASSTHLAATSDVSRYSGADRYDVAITVANEYSPGVPVLFIAKGTDYPDALSAAPAAAAGGGPLLLTLPDTLIPRVRAEIQRLQPAKIIVVGGEAAVSAAVYRELVTLSGTVTRIGGADRYETSRNLVDYAFGATGASRVYLATGTNFPDALAAGAVAGGMNAAVILVDGRAASIDAPTSALIRKLHPTDGAIAGGPVSVSTGIESSLSSVALPGGWQRFTGADRYATATSINQDAFDLSGTVYMATGANFPDALTGAVLAGSRRAPLFLVPGPCVTPGVATAIRSLSPARIVVFGGPVAVADAAQNLVECAAAPPVVVAPPVAVPPPVVSPPVAQPSGNPGDTKNCGSFGTWGEAQAWFLKYYPLYGDVAKLDADNDGDACETLPGHR